MSYPNDDTYPTQPSHQPSDRHIDPQSHRGTVFGGQRAPQPQQQPHQQSSSPSPQLHQSPSVQDEQREFHPNQQDEAFATDMAAHQDPHPQHLQQDVPQPSIPPQHQQPAQQSGGGDVGLSLLDSLNSTYSDAARKAYYDVDHTKPIEDRSFDMSPSADHNDVASHKPSHRTEEDYPSDDRVVVAPSPSQQGGDVNSLSGAFSGEHASSELSLGQEKKQEQTHTHDIDSSYSAYDSVHSPKSVRDTETPQENERTDVLPHQQQVEPYHDNTLDMLEEHKELPQPAGHVQLSAPKHYPELTSSPHHKELMASDHDVSNHQEDGKVESSGQDKGDGIAMYQSSPVPSDQAVAEPRSQSFFDRITSLLGGGSKSSNDQSSGHHNDNLTVSKPSQGVPMRDTSMPMSPEDDLAAVEAMIHRSERTSDDQSSDIYERKEQSDGVDQSVVSGMGTLPPQQDKVSHSPEAEPDASVVPVSSPMPDPGFHEEGDVPVPRSDFDNASEDKELRGGAEHIDPSDDEESLSDAPMPMDDGNEASSVGSNGTPSEQSASTEGSVSKYESGPQEDDDNLEGDVPVPVRADQSIEDHELTERDDIDERPTAPDSESGSTAHPEFDPQHESGSDPAPASHPELEHELDLVSQPEDDSSNNPQIMPATHTMIEVPRASATAMARVAPDRVLIVANGFNTASLGEIVDSDGSSAYHEMLAGVKLPMLGRDNSFFPFTVIVAPTPHHVILSGKAGMVIIARHTDTGWEVQQKIDDPSGSCRKVCVLQSGDILTYGDGNVHWWSAVLDDKPQFIEDKDVVLYDGAKGLVSDMVAWGDRGYMYTINGKVYAHIIPR